MAAKIIKLREFQPFVTRRSSGQLTRRRYHWLGQHMYSEHPGTSWSTEYWIKTSKQPETWGLYCLTEEGGKKKQFLGFYTPQALLEYFESVHFEVEHTDHELIQAINGAEVIPFSSKKS